MYNTQLEYIINQKINSNPIKDYAPNGLQIEGRYNIQHIITGVTASQQLLDYALLHRADAVMVHHGLFWKNETPIIRGMKRQRIKTLLINDINLYAWHLPLDLHIELGNNAQLALMLGVKVIGNLEPLLMYGEFSTPISGWDLRLKLEESLGRSMLHISDSGPDRIKKIAWCTGSGQKFIDLAASSGMDAFITGEASEQTIHVAREEKLHFYAAGHHATERGGIQALGTWLADQFALKVTFVDIYNPI